MSFMKHVGKHGDRKVAIVYRTLPGEAHMALVIYPDTLAREVHDSVMRLLESKEAQTEESLADAMFRNLLSDGSPMLTKLHREGKLKKVRTNDIIVTPNAQSHVRLSELNDIMDGMAAGDEAAQKMADLDANAGLIDPVEKRRNAALAEEAGEGVLDDSALAQDMLDQSKRMVDEAKSLTAESKRLEKEAFQLNPALKPKRRVAKKRATKKAS